MTRLSRKDWSELDRLLGLHGFGGYYDLVEALKQVAGDLGMTNTGVELYPEHDGGQSISLPQMVSYLRDWATILSRDQLFPTIAEKCGEEVRLERGGP